jgi:hypothetical protein
MWLGLMGLLDMNAAILLCAIAWNVEVPLGVAIAIAALMLIKACFYLKDIGSLEDIVVVALIILSFFLAIPAPILFMAAALVGFKGLCSLAA